MNKNPISPESLTVEELRADMPVVVVDATGGIAVKGVITQEPYYGDDGWMGAKIEIEDSEVPKEVPFLIYDSGVSCFSDGQWAQAFTRKH